jgi:hypothetical protein
MFYWEHISHGAFTLSFSPLSLPVCILGSHLPHPECLRLPPLISVYNLRSKCNLIPFSFSFFFSFFLFFLPYFPSFPVQPLDGLSVWSDPSQQQIRPQLYKCHGEVVYEFLLTPSLSFTPSLKVALQRCLQVMMRVYTALVKKSCYSNASLFDWILKLDHKIDIHLISHVAQELSTVAMEASATALDAFRGIIPASGAKAKRNWPKGHLSNHQPKQQQRQVCKEALEKKEKKEKDELKGK